MKGARRSDALLCLGIVVVLALPSASIALSASVVPVEDETKEWTLLIYWDSDNDLEPCAEFAMETWKPALTCDDEINLIVFMDIFSVSGAWIYDIHDGECHTVEAWDEMNCSDPATLETFLDYGLANYPAKKTMLVMQDHGYAWRGLCRDETDGNCIMTMDKMALAIRNSTERNDGVGVDILALDACDVATIEVAYELRDTVDYFAASELFVPDDGLPYDMILRALVANPWMTPRELAHDMVDMYMEYYSSKTLYEHMHPCDQDYMTFSAFDMSLMDELGDAFIEMTAVLEPLVADNADAVQAAWNHAFVTVRQSMGGWEFVPSAYTLFADLKGLDEGLDIAIDRFLDAFDAALVNEGSSDKLGDAPTGLNIWFPPCLANYNSAAWEWAKQFVYHDIGLDLVDSSSWVDCLMEYYFSEDGLQNRPNQVARLVTG
jgi:hypothetical protein